MKMMDVIGMKDIEELTVCGLCQQKFNHLDAVPKLLSCKHYFCVSCIKSRMVKPNGLYCMNCWKRTDLPECDPNILPTYNPVLALAENFTTIKHSVSSSNEPNGILTNGSGSPDIKKVETCQVHGMPLSLWCQTCTASVCRACTSQPEHPHNGHQITTQVEVTEKLTSEIQAETMTIAKLVNEVQHIIGQRRLFLMKVVEACITLKTHIETDLQCSLSLIPEIEEARTILNKTQTSISQIEGAIEAQNMYANLVLEKQKLQQKCQELYSQCHMNYIIKNSNVVFDFSLLKHVLENLNSPDATLSQQLTQNSPPVPDPLLLLSNYCIAQLYAKHAPKQGQQNIPVMLLPQLPQTVQYVQQNGGLDYPTNNSPTITPPTFTTTAEQPPTIPTMSAILQQPKVQTPAPVPVQLPIVRNPLPVFYFNIDVNSSPLGRILIKTRPDMAPKMAKNFSALATGELGYGYKGCNIFQCWEGESIITGDFEINNGRGGRSIYEDSFFVPDDTKFPAMRGAVGMRRTQKKHDSLGMVGSQFRIILQEMRGFTAIFGHVVEGIELVEKIASFGDQAGKPSKSIVIVSCGKL